MDTECRLEDLLEVMDGERELGKPMLAAQRDDLINNFDPKN